MTAYAYRDGYRLRKSGRFGYTVYAPDDGYIGYAEFGHPETIDAIINEYEQNDQKTTAHRDISHTSGLGGAHALDQQPPR